MLRACVFLLNYNTEYFRQRDRLFKRNFAPAEFVSRKGSACENAIGNVASFQACSVHLDRKQLVFAEEKLFLFCPVKGKLLHPAFIKQQTLRLAFEKRGERQITRRKRHIPDRGAVERNAYRFALFKPHAAERAIGKRNVRKIAPVENNVIEKAMAETAFAEIALFEDAAIETLPFKIFRRKRNRTESAGCLLIFAADDLLFVFGRNIENGLQNFYARVLLFRHFTFLGSRISADGKPGCPPLRRFFIIIPENEEKGKPFMRALRNFM